MQATAPGGVLVTCSCSQNVDAETFERIVAAGAKQAGREVRVFERRGAAPCHLVPPGVPRRGVPEGPPLRRGLTFGFAQGAGFTPPGEVYSIAR